MLIKSILFVSILGLSLLLVGCDPDEHDHPQAKTGRELFEAHCAPCHQKDGKGLFIKGFPSIQNTQLDAWQISHKIRDEESTDRKMPTFSNMSESEALLISNYIKSLK